MMHYIVVGTRPEIIKMSPLVEAFSKNNIDFRLVHTGQHYSYDMDRVFFDELELPNPDYKFDIGSGTHAETTSKILLNSERIMLKDIPESVLVEGDTNTVLGSALAAVKLNIKVAHVEAGLRSNDLRMPEEYNRILTDHISEYLFAPTNLARDNLLKENIDKDKIFVTGNTIVDAVYRNLGLSSKKSSIMDTLGLNKDKYILLTMHRQENVDDKRILADVIDALNKISAHYGIKIIFPIHPRTEKNLINFNLNKELSKDILKINPTGYLDFLELEKNARLILTDSGGVQEEACILKIPCVTLRLSTERPETVHVGANVVAGLKTEGILNSVETMINKKRSWSNPFGDGNSSKKIVKVLMQ
ncbi:MAG: UDP-N-acetylglucosamine 2-epimerase (non-hydrolyzing) [Nanoarchaeota archaeon]